MSATASYVNQWAFEDGASVTWSGTSETWDFEEGSDMVKSQPLLNGTGLMGNREEDVSRTRLGPYDVSGTLTCEPSAAFMSAFLPRVMGGGTATSPTLADAVPEFGILQDKGGDVYEYNGCKINRMTISGGARQLIKCAMDILGKTEATDEASFSGAAMGSSAAYEPFQFADLALTLAGSARTVLDFRLVIDNGLTARFANGLTANQIIEGRRSITLEAKAVFTSTEAGNLYGLAKDGAAGSLVLTGNGVSTTFTFSRVQIPDNAPRSEGGEVVLPISAQIRGTSLGAEMTATNDITP